jgi:polysaccharide export outer membrane protein
LIRRTFAAWSLLALAGCAAFPHSGPTTHELARNDSAENDRVEIVKVTPALAQQLAQGLHDEQAARVDGAVTALGGNPTASPAVRLAAGDQLTVTLWSFGAESDTVQPNQLGRYVVDREGDVSLPYAGRVALAGLELPEAQRRLTARFAGMGMFKRPSAVIALDQSASSAILVTGAIGDPKLVQWSPGGRTLAEALTEALGGDSSLLREDGDARARAAVEVDVQRGTKLITSIPMETALRATLALQPGDRVIVRKQPKVYVTMLGGGIRQNGELAFAHPPALTDALARASGLDTNVADGHAVFVLRRTGTGKPQLYDFAWDRTQGMIAAQQFRLIDEDVVYVAEAPVVPVQKIVGLLFQFALPVQAVK